MAEPNYATLNEIIALLSPLMESEADRRALLRSAFLGTSLVDTISYGGATRPFMLNMLITLYHYGEIEPGKQALWRLLEIARDQVGLDKQARIDALQTVINTPAAEVAQAQQAAAEVHVGKKAGQYRLCGTISVTPTATIHRAYREGRRDRPLAIKELRWQFAKDRPDNILRFRREIEVLQKLNHPHIARYEDSGEREGAPYLVMPFYQRGALAQCVEAEGPLALSEAVRILRQIADALHAAHTQNIIHRDVKPSNILFDDQNNAVLTDFGVAMVADATLQITATGTLLGTPMYAAPEQIRGDEVDVRTDVYSLGMTLYYMLTGQPPFDAPSDMALIALRLKGAAPPHPSEVRPDIPRAVGDVVMKAIRENSARRYQTPLELAEAFAQAVEASKSGERGQAGGRMSRRAFFTVGGATFVLALVLLAVAVVPRLGEETSSAPTATTTFTSTPAPSATSILTNTATPPLPTLTSTPTPSATSIPTNTATPPPPTPTTPFFPAGGEPEWMPVLGELELKGVPMVYVPAGCFMMGSEDGNTDEKPVHEVCLDAYWIGKTEVTNAQYKACVDAGACMPPYTDSEYCHYNDPAYASHPVVCVDWFQAQAYAEWLGGSLPTEAQWEYAARGPAGNVYPWGSEEPTCALVNYAGCVNDTSPVGSYLDGASWVGALDMAGNVWEWCLSEYRDYPYDENDGRNNPNSDAARVLRGGSFLNDQRNARAASRNGNNPRNQYWYFGFRVASLFLSS
ncbi:MAG: SUMF1/EgtB/PvdO family nonheme iron enzyme [Anaerolineae bacterium]|nr:SUMF1/EgtB/PvdO family nonheme iron enzyme [Anaerolineae bacterium]